MMEKHVTTMAEIGCPSGGGVVSVSQQVLSPSYDENSPTLKEFTYSGLLQGIFGRTINSATYEPWRFSDKIVVAI
ncbi:hypothetical protein Tco_0943579 [Tanacetum coccineum]